MMIDLNCDMGEGFGAYTIGDDRQMLGIVSSANIACGFHGGDPRVMHQTLELAKANRVQPGAHPGFFDLFGFGRRQIRGDSLEEVEWQIIYQIGALQGLAKSLGCRVRHVKAHGSLGNMAAEEPELATAVAKAIKAVDPKLIFVVMPGLETERAGHRLGLPMAREIYADRAYAESGNLLPRKTDGAVIHDPIVARDRVLKMLKESAVVTASGALLPAQIDSVCVHGDTPGAVAMARELRRGLEEEGLKIRPMSEVIAGHSSD
jgi:5-oxoprolinase (ATP-hydrolysing) subunit A